MEIGLLINISQRSFQSKQATLYVIKLMFECNWQYKALSFRHSSKYSVLSSYLVYHHFAEIPIYIEFHKNRKKFYNELLRIVIPKILDIINMYKSLQVKTIFLWIKIFALKTSLFLKYIFHKYILSLNIVKLSKLQIQNK